MCLHGLFDVVLLMVPDKLVDQVDDEELFEIVEMEIRELLDLHGFPGMSLQRGI